MSDKIQIKDLGTETPTDVDYLVFQRAVTPYEVYKAPKSDIEGHDAFVYIAYADDDSGTGFTLTFNASKNYIAILSTETEIPSPVVGDFAGLWKNYKGATGATGDNATADAGTTTTLPAGSSATVTNVGTTSDAVFDFAIPQGIQGDDGACVESVAFVGNDMVFTLDDESTVTLVGAKTDLKGDTGDTGASIVSASFVGDDLVFVKDDSTTVTLTGAKTTLKGSTGDAGDDAYVYIAYASDASGTGFTMTFNALLDYIAIKNTTVAIPSPSASDFTGLWKNYKGIKGDTGDIGIDWQGAWSAGTYNADDAVEHNGSSWIATTTTTEEPSISATDWDLLALKGTDGTGTGDVVGPATNTDNYIPQWDGANSKTLKNGLPISTWLQIAGISGGQTAIGGTGVTDILKLQGTTGNGTLTSPAIQALVGNNGATTAMTILNNGNVGVGTTGPLEKLHVSGGNIIFDNGYNLRSRTYAGSVSNVFGTTASNQLLFGSGNWDSISFDVGGAAGRMYINSSGNVGIGTTAPTAVLHLKAGTATANTAPLKLTSGTLLTTPETGAIEFLTDAYYGTITTGTARKQFVFTDGSITGNAGTVTNGIYTTSDATALAATSAGNKDKYLHSNASTGVLEWSAPSFTLADNTVSAGKLMGASSTKLADGSAGNLLKSLGDGTFGWDTSTYLTSASTLDASKLSGAIPSAVTATTQSAGDNSTKLATTAYTDAKVEDSITDGVTTKAPSENAVFDALALKDTKTDLTKYSNLYSPEGFLINGKIVPSVASNNLTIAIKGMDGNDPSASNPVYVRIDNTIRSITSALSITTNAGTNWMNAGSAELATKEIDYFVYLGYNATDGVVIGFSRIPFATIYSDFSTTNTNEKFCAISTITNVSSSDHYNVIGRFASTLSAGAGYTWTVPTFTGANLIQRPIFETRWLQWQPVYSGNGAMTFTSVTTNTARYLFSNINIYLSINAQGTVGGTPDQQLLATMPIEPSSDFTGANKMACAILNNSIGSLGILTIITGYLRFQRNPPTDNWSATGYAQISGQIFLSNKL